MADPYELERFVTAQNRDGTYDTAVRELKAGRKRSHWMWFVFPQMSELGYTHTAKFFGIGSRDEAVAYLAHDVLGPRLHLCTQLVVRSPVKNPNMLMGGAPDDTKLKSSMTLFAEVADDGADFAAVLNKYFRGERDRQTLRLLGPTKPTTTGAAEIDVRRAPKRWRPWRR